MTSPRAFADATHVLATQLDDYLTEWGDSVEAIDRITDGPPPIASQLRTLAADIHNLEGEITAAVKADDLTLDLQ